ncbi:hypothetical protein IAD21_02485 [Abditibacteriota bacterium]|nr:hypothetical protein IAD21_02485 [Abditibacteriota bacterium]
MPRSFVSARARVAALLAAGAVVGGIFAPVVHAQTQDQDSVQLSASALKRFDSQVRVLQNTRTQLSASRRKLDSSLWVTLSSASLRTKLPSLRVLKSTKSLDPRKLTILGEVTPRLVSQITRLGGTILSSFSESDELNVLMTPAVADKIALYPEVQHIIPTLGAFTKRNLANTGRTTATGPTNSEGDTTHQAGAARSQFGVTGQNIKIGVISDSVDFLTASQKSKELGPVTVLANQGGTGEGTAMLEIIHDLAPDSPLYFSTSGNTAGAMARAITNLTNAGCKIIVDDIGFFNEPVYQDGVVARAITTATGRGVLYFSAAGNDGRRSFGQSQTWEGTFVDAGTPAQFNLPLDSSYRLNSWAGRAGTSAFNRLNRIGTDQIRDLYLWWADPVGQSENNYDLYACDSQGNILASSTNVQNGDGLPFESLYDGNGDYLNDGDLIVVTREVASFGSNQRVPLRLFSNTARFGFSTRGATYGHAASVDSVCVAAAPAAAAFPPEPKALPGPYPGPFVANSPIEPFSSDGPRAMYFAPDGTPKAVTLLKPDITAADGVVTSVPGFDRFYGTSAAAPHAAAIAALVWSLDPTQTNTQVRTKLTDSALRTGSWNPDSGYGIVMAPRALTAAGTTITVSSISGREGSTAYNATVTVLISKPLPYPVTINYVTQDGTATAGSDYVATTGSIVIPATKTSARFYVRILGDTTPENNEQFTVTASSPSLSPAPSVATITLLNDDGTPASSPSRSNGNS